MSNTIDERVASLEAALAAQPKAIVAGIQPVLDIINRLTKRVEELEGKTDV